MIQIIKPSYFLFLSLWIGFSLLDCGSRKEVSLSDCKQISEIPGPEDFAIDRETGWMFISSHDRRNFESVGSIFSYHIPSGKLQKSSTSFPMNFRPHGVSFVKMGKSKKLYVISHQSGEKPPHSIEIFRLEKGEITHESTLQDESLISPNDLFVMEDGKIFVSNDLGSNSKFKNFWDVIWKRNSSPISFFDGVKWSFLEPLLAVGNGIHYKKKDGKEYLYRASMLDNLVVKYEVNWDKNLPILKQSKVLNLESSADNFEEDDKGNLILVGHPSKWKFLRHASSKENLTPTQVFRIFPDDTWEEIYYNHGKEISAGSTGGIYAERLFIGQVFEPFLLNCKY